MVVDWTRTIDWCTGGGVGTHSTDVPVRAAEWLAEHRAPAPKCAAIGIYGLAAVVAALELWPSGPAVALLWAPIVVLAVAIGARAATLACIVLSVGVGVIADRDVGLPTDEVVLDAVIRAAGLLTLAVITSWSVLATVELARRSRTDASTGLLNRAGFLAAAARERERALRNGTTLSIVYFDLDGLKTANDQSGHAHGDVVIAHFARHLDQSRRVVDVAGRLGGDEFGLLLPSTDGDGVQHVLRRLYHQIDRDPDCLPASAGAVTWAHPPSVATMLRQADRLMYRSKRDGGRSWAILDLAVDVGPRRDRGAAGRSARDRVTPPTASASAHHGG